MQIWDSGSYSLIRGSHIEEEAVAGEIKITFRGKRIRGEWHLVRTRGDDWLLFKARDAYVRDGAYLVAPGVDLSLLRPVDTRPRRMRPKRTVQPFDSTDWVFELKLPGVAVRISACEEPKIVTPRNRNLTANFPQIADVLAGFRCTSALVDGVLVKQDLNGLPSKETTVEDLPEESDETWAVYVYDLVVWDDFDVCSLPLVAKKEILRSLVPDSRIVLFVDFLAADGTRVAAAARLYGAYALIAKRRNSRYTGGRSDAWRTVAREDENETPFPPLEIRCTNSSKVFWPETDRSSVVTEGELFDYYSAVSHLLVPHLIKRPVHLRRYPSGIHGKEFFQRHLPDTAPEWLEPMVVRGDESRYIPCGNRESLLYLANLGSIELHPWLSRACPIPVNLGGAGN